MDQIVNDRRLLRHLIAAVLLKLALLTLLWWWFVRDARVAVDADAAASHFSAIPAAASTEGTRR